MAALHIHVRLHHGGQFQKTSYVGGQQMTINQVDVDTFSYIVLLEFIKDYLHYTEIGGVYSRASKGGWQLVSNDRDLIPMVEGCSNDDEVDFYIDNTIDKDIEPLGQMQPHVIVRPRKNLIGVSPKKNLKRKFVSTHQLQQQLKTRKSPRLCKGTGQDANQKDTGAARRKLDLQTRTSEGEKTGENAVAEKVQNPPLTRYEKNKARNVQENAEALKLQQQQQELKTRKSPRFCKGTGQDANQKDTGTTRRKLDIQTGTSEGEKTGENVVAEKVRNPPLTRYEKNKIRNLQENAKVLNALGIMPLVTGLKETEENSKKQGKNRDKDHDKDEEDVDYHPEKEDTVVSEDTSKRANDAKKKKTAHQGPGPRTRSRANAAAAGKEPSNTGTENEKEVTSSYCALALKPTCSKVFQHASNGATPGSVNAYLAMRERQKKNIEEPATVSQDVPELNWEENADEVAKPAVRKRGRTKLAKVHARGPEDKIVITLNEKNQPISENQKIITELTNFVGSLAKDNVSLTYINWRLVLKELKNEMWDYTRARYIIPDVGRKWFNTTLNDAWRGYKSRMKGKWYSSEKTLEEMVKERPEDIPLEDFKMLLKYWGDEEVQKLAKKNSDRRTKITDVHTMGPKSLAQVRNKLKNEDPQHAPSSDASVYIETRKRKPGKNYKTNTKAVATKISNIQQMLTSGHQVEADAMVTKDKQHGKTWLVGRGGKFSRDQSTVGDVPSDPYVQELTAKIKRDLEIELEDKVNKKVQENMAWVLKKLGDANPDLNLDIGEFCPAVSSEDDFGTPFTEPGISS